MTIAGRKSISTKKTETENTRRKYNAQPQGIYNRSAGESERQVGGSPNRGNHKRKPTGRGERAPGHSQIPKTTRKRNQRKIKGQTDSDRGADKPKKRENQRKQRTRKEKKKKKKKRKEKRKKREREKRRRERKKEEEEKKKKGTKEAGGTRDPRINKSRVGIKGGSTTETKCNDLE